MHCIDETLTHAPQPYAYPHAHSSIWSLTIAPHFAFEKAVRDETRNRKGEVKGSVCHTLLNLVRIGIPSLVIPLLCVSCCIAYGASLTDACEDSKGRDAVWPSLLLSLTRAQWLRGRLACEVK